MSALAALGTLGFGVIVGIVSAYLGVGGGILMVPFVALVLAHGQHVAEGTALLVSLPTALVGVLSHWRSGYVRLASALPMAVGGVIGSFVGARVALGLQGDTLRSLFGALLIAAGGAMVARGLRAARVEGS